jgi:hypothetical protein
MFKSLSLLNLDKHFRIKIKVFNLLILRIDECCSILSTSQSEIFVYYKQGETNWFPDFYDFGDFKVFALGWHIENICFSASVLFGVSSTLNESKFSFLPNCLQYETIKRAFVTTHAISLLRNLFLKHVNQPIFK